MKGIKSFCQKLSEAGGSVPPPSPPKRRPRIHAPAAEEEEAETSLYFSLFTEVQIFAHNVNYPHKMLIQSKVVRASLLALLAR